MTTASNDITNATASNSPGPIPVPELTLTQASVPRGHGGTRVHSPGSRHGERGWGIEFTSGDMPTRVPGMRPGAG